MGDGVGDDGVGDDGVGDGVGNAVGDGEGDGVGEGVGEGIKPGVGEGVGLGIGVGVNSCTIPWSLTVFSTKLFTGLTISTSSSASVDATSKTAVLALAGAIV